MSGTNESGDDPQVQVPPGASDQEAINRSGSGVDIGAGQPVVQDELHMFQGWPICDKVLVKDYSGNRSVPRYLFRIHMDIPIRHMSSDLENYVASHDGQGILRTIEQDLRDGTPRAFRVLRAALGCDDFATQNATSPPAETESGSSSATGDLLLVKDYSLKAWPANILRFHVDVELKGGQATFEEIQHALDLHDTEGVLQILKNDKTITGGFPKFALATLMASLGPDK
ncbi:MAG TPA: hypothetical protein VNC11_00030 [Gemmatimonadaceae bacterium]|nr:hypothetical protein [Gemmatimonadaceae bacterium]